MTVKLTKLKYTDFHDNEMIAHIICAEINDFENTVETNRTFIVFEDDYDLDKIMAIIQKHEIEIHAAIGNMKKITLIINEQKSPYDTIEPKITSYTSYYWEDVRLFSHINGSNYAEDNYNTSAIELALNKFIKLKYYNKDKLIEACKVRDIDDSIKLLNQSQFTAEELHEILEWNTQVKHVFEMNNLHKLLVEQLPEKNISNTTLKI